MKKLSQWRPFGLVLLALLLVTVLSAREMTPAAPPPEERKAFDDAIVQRQEIIKQLKELTALVKEQNDLLKSGKMRVVVEAK